MVKQTRHIFDLADVKAVRLQCNQCKGEVVQSAPVYKYPLRCPLCSCEWVRELPAGVPHPDPNQDLARAIIAVLQANGLPATTRFEIDGEEE